VNLRSSCRTDLQEHFPDHVINTWLGHSSRIAERHYLQTTDGHWEKATQTTTAPIRNGGNAGGNAGGNISANPGEHVETTNAKIPENSTADAVGFPGIIIRVPPQGLERNKKNKGEMVGVGQQLGQRVGQTPCLGNSPSFGRV
jgi:hypothetical protein